MGLSARTWARTVRGGKPVHKFLLLEMSEWCKDGEDTFYRSQGQLAEALDISDRYLRTVLKDLVESGIISILNNGNQFRPTYFKLNLDTTELNVNRNKMTVNRNSSSASLKSEPEQNDSEPEQTGKVNRNKMYSEPEQNDIAIEVLKRKEKNIKRKITEEYSVALSVLGEIQNFKRDEKKEASLVKRLKAKSVSPESAEATAQKMAATIWYERGKWHYQAVRGKRSYIDLYKTFGNWCVDSRAPPPSVNGHGNAYSGGSDDAKTGLHEISREEREAKRAAAEEYWRKLRGTPTQNT